MAKKEEKEIITYDLQLDNGDQIRITIPGSIHEDVRAQMEEHIRKGDMWWCGDFVDLTAMYRGNSLGTINMARVVGWH